MSARSLILYKTAMATVRIYTTPICPYCARAKSLLEKKGATYAAATIFTRWTTKAASTRF